VAGENDFIHLRISAKFATLPPDVRSHNSLQIHAPVEEVLHEILPGTGILIAVQAASKDETFMRRLRASLSKLPAPPDSVEAARQQLATVRQTTIAGLAQQLQNEKTSSYVRASTLIRLQAEAPVLAALTNRSRIVQRNALYALADESVSEAAVAPLLSLLQDGDSERRVLAMSALGRIHKGKEAVVPVLLTLLQDHNFQIQKAAADTLGAYNVPAKTLLPVYLAFLSDTNAELRKSAIGLGVRWALGDDENATVVPPLLKTPRDANNDVRLMGVTALSHIMNQKLRGGAHPRDERQAHALGSFAPQATLILSAIIQSLSDTNSAVRAAAANGLGEMGPFDPVEDAKIVAALIQALTDENKDVRSRATMALDNFGAEAKDAIPVLAKMASQPKQDFGDLAGLTLARTKGAVYALKLDEILRKKYPRLDADAAPITKTAATHWIAETNTVPGIDTPALLIKRAVFGMRAMGPHPIQPADIDFIVFKLPRTGKVWVGWDMDFYAETDSTIIGGILTPYGSIDWHKDLADPLDGQVERAIAQFEKRVNDAKIKGESSQTTDLRSAVKTDFFYLPNSGQAVMPKFLGLQVNGEELQLDLENPETSGRARFWIDLKSRKVLKALEQNTIGLKTP
jgi:HEAT repeat protein